MSDKPPSPLQIAYLRYMKIDGAATMTREQVDATFRTLHTPVRNLGDEHGLSGEWYRDRGLLFPREYPQEREQSLDRILRGYVRSKVVVSSERLTKDRVLQIVHEFDAEDILWHLQPGHKERFYSRVQQLYPRCCDGIPRTDAATATLGEMAASTEDIALKVLAALKAEQQRARTLLQCRPYDEILREIAEHHRIPAGAVQLADRYLKTNHLIKGVQRQDGFAALPSSEGIAYLKAHETSIKEEKKSRLQIRQGWYTIVIGLLSLLVALLAYRSCSQ